MPPIQQQLSNIEAIEDIAPSSSSDPIENDNNNKDKNRRGGRRLPSIDTRASRVGVTNFINVIKNLHPGESRNYFPITQEALQEYIDSKRKALIKAGSLEQYLQHMQAYNIALGFGWQGQVFGPIIKKALDELRAHEEEIQKNQQVNVPLSNLNSIDSLQNLRQLYMNIASLNLPSQWGTVDTSHLHCRIGNSQHFGLTDELAFTRFWQAFVDNINEHDKQIQLVLYRDSSASASSSPQQIHAFGLTSETILKSVTIRSKVKIYKQKIAIGENTTFASLIAFATYKAMPPAGKQFVIRSIDESFEYIPEDLVKVVITGIEHADLLVTLEDVGPIDFDYF
ncbi:8484_t:CDS:2 [Ambispora gerdemannii]|uniref:8484_t:CDS:1 n=1 Tax=Ambispora gerdemannii TaxID=144530 RepID=A0A9N9ALU7_9GLOM|nr:8484_t:CDS:2 [Ambispora gerdemannii]